MAVVKTTDLIYIDAVDPTSSEDFTAGYKVDDSWRNSLTNESFICSGDGVWKSKQKNIENAAKSSLYFSFPLSGVVDNNITVLGTLNVVDTAETGDYTTDFPVSNQHVSILVNSITTGGDIVITGTSLDESTATPVTGDTETITVDTSTGQYYQTTKKWWEITDINITGGAITGINYDILNVGYYDSGNGNFKIIGYRADMRAQANNSDITVKFTKIQDDGSGKMSLIDLESMGVDSGTGTDQVIDGVRTAGDDRSYNPAVSNVWLNNTVLTFKQGDFDTYYSSDENVFESSDKDEGLIVSFEGAPSGGLSQVDFITLRIDIESI